MPQASHPTLVVTAAEFNRLVQVRTNPFLLPHRGAANTRSLPCQADELFAGRSQDPTTIVALDGSKCAAQTTDGVMWTGSAANCVDLGVGNASSNRWQFEYLPTPSHGFGRSPSAEQRLLRERLQAQMGALQLIGGARGSPRGCGVAQDVYFINEVPTVGFGSVIEYGMMFLARAVTLRKQLVFGVPRPPWSEAAAPLISLPPPGPRSSPAWTSDYFCGPEARSLSCYFSVSSCDALLHLGDEPSASSEGLPLALMPRRRNPLNIGLAGFDTYGSAWVSAELATFFFSRMTAPTAAEVRAGPPGRGAPLPCPVLSLSLPAGEQAARVGRVPSTRRRLRLGACDRPPHPRRRLVRGAPLLPRQQDNLLRGGGAAALALRREPRAACYGQRRSGGALPRGSAGLRMPHPANGALQVRVEHLHRAPRREAR